MAHTDVKDAIGSELPLIPSRGLLSIEDLTALTMHQTHALCGKQQSFHPLSLSCPFSLLYSFPSYETHFLLHSSRKFYAEADLTNYQQHCP